MIKWTSSDKTIIETEKSRILSVRSRDCDVRYIKYLYGKKIDTYETSGLYCVHGKSYGAKRTRHGICSVIQLKNFGIL